MGQWLEMKFSHFNHIVVSYKPSSWDFDMKTFLLFIIYVSYRLREINDFDIIASEIISEDLKFFLFI